MPSTAEAPSQPPKLGHVLRTGGHATLGVVAGLQVLDSVDGVVFVVFAPEIRESLGISSAAVAVLGALAGVMVSLASLPLGLLGDRHRRTTIAGICTLVWAGAAGLLGLAQHLWHAVAVRVVAGIGKANEGPVQTSLLVDAYPQEGRGRVLGLHRAGQPLGIVTGPLLAAAFAAVIPAEHEPWRWTFAFLAVPAVVLGLAALRLPEPVRTHVPPRPAKALVRLKGIRTFVLVTVALSAFGMCVTTVPIYLNLVLQDHLGQSAAARGVVTSVCAVGGLLGAAIGGSLSDRLFRRSPAACVHLAALAVTALGIGFAVQAHVPNVLAYAAIGVVTQGLTFAGVITLSLVVAAVTPPEIRATAFAAVGVSVALVGGLGGALVTGVAESLWGARTAIAVVAPSASVLAGLVLLSCVRHVRRDIAGAADLR